MPGRDGLAGAATPARVPPASVLPSVPGVLTAEQILATGRSIAASQQRDGAIGWPDGHADPWNHVECAMALSACGLRDAARRAYDWLRAGAAPGRIVAEGDSRRLGRRYRGGEQPGRLPRRRRLA
jgi:hypothetical protein